MRIFFYFLLLFIINSTLIFSQILVDKNKINPSILNDFWPAKWITCPDASIQDYAVFHFRKSFALDKVPEEFIVHISADNRYILYVNGKLVTYGPARGDLQHWRFEPVDINEYLTPGNNVIAAVVWNFGEHIPAAQMTRKTAFIIFRKFWPYIDFIQSPKVDSARTGHLFTRNGIKCIYGTKNTQKNCPMDR